MSGLIVHVERGDPDESRDLDLAQAISNELNRVYQNHYWLVSFQGHNLIVRHVLIASLVATETNREGFGALLPREKIGTVHEAQKQAVEFAGKLLEAFGLPRGPWDGAHVPVMPADLRTAILKGKQLRGWK